MGLDMLESLLVSIRLKLYPFLHRLFCYGDLGIYVPKSEYMEETGDTEVYMQCSKCDKRYHLINITLD